MGHHSTLFGKAFHMFSLPAKEGFGDKQREISIDVARFLEHAVQLMLHFLPNGVAIRLDDHTATYGRLLCQVGLDHQFIVPLGIVLTTFCEVFQFYCHCI